MNINSITTAGVAASVWNNATRVLTADVVPLSEVNLNTSLGAGLVLDCRAPAGKFRWITTHGGNTQNVAVYYDGVAAQVMQVTASTVVDFTGVAGSLFGLSVKNTSAGALATAIVCLQRG